MSNEPVLAPLPPEKLTSGHRSLSMAAMAAGKAPSKTPGDEVFKAAKKGRLDVLTRILSEHPNAVNYKKTLIGNATPLLGAIFDGKAEAIKCLLAHGADPNLRGNDGWSPLGVLLLYGSKFGPLLLELARVLLDAGADPDQPYKSTSQAATSVERPIHLAMQRDGRALIHLLIEYGADNGGENPFDGPDVPIRSYAYKYKLA